MDEEEIRASVGCNHTHSCNPPAPEDASHSHTCFHTHTHLIVPGQQENDHSDSSNKRRSCGNREAVKKYREKKKARTAYLEDEVKRLQFLNEHLIRKLQSQATVETEVIRLRTLLVGIQGNIDGELGGFSFQKQSNDSGFVFKEGRMDRHTISVPCNHTMNVMCEVPRAECEESKALHEPIHSFFPHSPPFSR